MQPCPTKGSRTAVSRAPGSTSTAGQAAGATQAPGISMAVSLEGASALLQNRTAPLPVPAGAQGVLQLQDAVRTAHPNSFLGSLNSSACPAAEPQGWSSRCKAQLLLTIHPRVISAFTSLPPSPSCACVLSSRRFFQSCVAAVGSDAVPTRKGEFKHRSCHARQGRDDLGPAAGRWKASVGNKPEHPKPQRWAFPVPSSC